MIEERNGSGDVSILCTTFSSCKILCISKISKQSDSLCLRCLLFCYSANIIVLTCCNFIFYQWYSIFLHRHKAKWKTDTIVDKHHTVKTLLVFHRFTKHLPWSHSTVSLSLCTKVYCFLIPGNVMQVWSCILIRMFLKIIAIQLHCILTRMPVVSKLSPRRVMSVMT